MHRAIRGAVRLSDVRQGPPGNAEEWFGKAFAASPVAVTITDVATGRFVDLNPAAEELLGYSRTEVLGRTSPEMGIIDSAARARLIERYTAAGRARNEEVLIRSKSGGTRTVLLSGEFADHAGRRLIIASMVDITERKEAEDELRKSRSSLAESQRIAHLGSWEWDLVRDDARWSEELFRIYGLDVAPSGGDLAKAMTLTHPEDRDRVTRAVKDALDGVRPYAAEFRVVRPSGEVRHVRARGEVTRDASGRPVRMFGTVYDRTEAKLAEDERVRAASALHDAEERYRTLVDGLDAIVWEADIGRERFRFVSHHVETMLGYPASDLQDHDNFWELHVHPQDYERELQRRNAPSGGAEHHVAEYRVKAADGRWVWVRDVVRAVIDGAGRASHLSGVMIDISEAVALQQYRENLVDVISHEFRTPVTVIQGYAELLTNAQAKLSAEQAMAARERIRSASQHLAYLLGSITELSRLRGGGPPPRKEPLGSRELIGEAVAALKAKGKSVESAVKIHISRGAERIEADRRKTIIALVELLDNAAKFSPPGQPIWVEARPEGEWLVITVEDKGPGIADEMRDNLFKPFVQADMTAVRATGGAGLGLAVVSGLVQAQGGRVEVDTVVGEGSAFHIMLPRAMTARAPLGRDKNGAAAGNRGT